MSMCTIVKDEKTLCPTFWRRLRGSVQFPRVLQHTMKEYTDVRQHFINHYLTSTGFLPQHNRLSASADFVVPIPLTKAKGVFPNPFPPPPTCCHSVSTLHHRRLCRDPTKTWTHTRTLVEFLGKFALEGAYTKHGSAPKIKLLQGCLSRATSQQPQKCYIHAWGMYPCIFKFTNTLHTVGPCINARVNKQPWIIPTLE